MILRAMSTRKETGLRNRGAWIDKPVLGREGEAQQAGAHLVSESHREGTT